MTLPELDPAAVYRLYDEGFTAADLLDMPADYVLVEPIKPPEQTTGGLFHASGKIDIPGTACVVYRVVRIGDLRESFESIDVDVGDVVILRNAMLDPITARMDLLLIGRQHIVSKVKVPLKARDG